MKLTLEIEDNFFEVEFNSDKSREVDAAMTALGKFLEKIDAITEVSDLDDEDEDNDE